MLHQAEKLELEASPYVVYAYTPYISVTRTDTWTQLHSRRRSRRRPAVRDELAAAAADRAGRQDLGSNYAGTGLGDHLPGRRSRCWWSAIGRWRRRREEREPFERARRPSRAAGAGASVRIVLSKLAVALGTLLFVLVFNFFLFRIAGDPIKDLIRGNPHLTEQGRERLIKRARPARELPDPVPDLRGRRRCTATWAPASRPTSRSRTMIRAALPNTLILVGTLDHPGGDLRHPGSASTPPRTAAPRATPGSCRARCSSTRCPTSGRA